MSEWILSEQRWTSTRNWVQRTLKLSFFCFLFSALAGAGRTYWDYLKYWSPLQRIYVRQYLYSAIPKILSGRSQYQLLVLMIPTKAKGFNRHLATDEDATPLDEKRFLLTEVGKGRGALAVCWQTFHRVKDEEMYAKFRDLIYQGQSPWKWCRPGRQVGLGTFLVLVIVGLVWDR